MYSVIPDSILLLTNPYRISHSDGAQDRSFWFGAARLTNPYRRRACDECSDLVGLDLITVLYHGAILARPRPSTGFTNTPPPLEGITHSTVTMCYVGL